MAVFVISTPPPKPNASAPTTVPTPKRYDPSENGMDASVVRQDERADRGGGSVKRALTAPRSCLEPNGRNELSNSPQRERPSPPCVGFSLPRRRSRDDGIETSQRGSDPFGRSCNPCNGSGSDPGTGRAWSGTPVCRLPYRRLRRARHFARAVRDVAPPPRSPRSRPLAHAREVRRSRKLAPTLLRAAGGR